MSDFDAAAAIQAQRIQSQIEFAVLARLHKEEKSRAQAVVGLIEQAAQTAQQIRSRQPHLGRALDIDG